jgi:ankyrin repeat protein
MFTLLICLQQGNTALHLAAINNHAKVVKMLLNAQSDVNIQNEVTYFKVIGVNARRCSFTSNVYYAVECRVVRH